MVLFENKGAEAGKKRKDTLSDQHKVNQETFGPMTFSQSVHGGGRHQNLRNNGRGGNRGQRGGRGGYQNSRSNQNNTNNASATTSTPVSNAGSTPQTD
jgi:hypothetical protein